MPTAPGHLPNAVNVHEIFTYLATSTPEGMHELKTKFADAFGKAGLSGKETAVIYEQSMNSGFGQSCRGYYLLTMLGYPKIKVLHGGFDAWAAKGLPVTTEVPNPAPASFAIVPEAGDILIDAKTMLAAVGKPGIALLDVRDVDEWIGESSSPYGKDFCPRKGRIPGAVWLEWYRMMKPTRGRAALQVQGRDSGGMRHRRHFPRLRRSISIASRARGPRTPSSR